MSSMYIRLLNFIIIIIIIIINDSTTETILSNYYYPRAMSRVFANSPGNWGSIPGRVIPKT